MTTPRDAIGLSDRLRRSWICNDGYLVEPSKRELEAAKALDALQARVVELERDCAEAYQVVGTLAAAHLDLFSDPQVVKALDNLSAASSGDPRPHDGLLPFAPLSLDDPLATAESRATSAEQERDALRKTLRIERDCSLNETRLKDKYKRERDEAYERACGVIRQWTNHAHMQLCAGEMTAQERRTTEAILNAVERQVRRLAAGTEKEGK